MPSTLNTTARKQSSPLSNARTTTPETAKRNINAFTDVAKPLPVATQATQNIANSTLKQIQGNPTTYLQPVAITSPPGDSNTYIVLSRDGEKLNEKVINMDGRGRDAIKVIADKQYVSNFTATDDGDYTSKNGHSDAIQIIPKGDEFLGAISKDVTVENFQILAGKTSGALQGIVATDGCFTNLTIRDGVISTGSPNKLLLSGMASGAISNVHDEAGGLIKPRLEPLRIGGGGNGLQNIYVLSLNDENHACSPKPLKGNNTVVANDVRRIMPRNNTNDIGLCDFNLDRFKYDMGKMTVKDALSNQKVKQHIDDWLSDIEKTQQVEFKGKYALLQQQLGDGAALISQLSGEIKGEFYREFAKNYGHPCSKGK